MTPLRQTMLEEMKLSGLSAGTQKAYLNVVIKLSQHYNRSPAQLSEQEVRRYLLACRDNNMARGTFKGLHFGLQFLYENVLNKNWPLFVKKRYVNLHKNVCPPSYPMLMFSPC